MRRNGKKAKEHYIDFLKRGTPEHIHEFFSDDQIQSMWNIVCNSEKAEVGSPPDIEYIIFLAHKFKDNDYDMDGIEPYEPTDEELKELKLRMEAPGYGKPLDSTTIQQKLDGDIYAIDDLPGYSDIDN
mgnify:CR=1 FL=1